MKKFIAFCSTAVLATTLMFTPGCSTVVTTNPNGTTTTNKVVNAAPIVASIDIIVPPAVQIAINKDQNARQYFNDTTVALDTVLAGTNFSAATVQAQVNGLVSTSPEAKAAVDAGLALYQSFASQYVTAGLSNTQLQPVLQALDNSIKLGVAMANPATTNGTAVTVKVK